MTPPNAGDRWPTRFIPALICCFFTSIALSSGSTMPGASVFSLASSADSSPAGLQWTLNLPPSDVAAITMSADYSKRALDHLVVPVLCDIYYK